MRSLREFRSAAAGAGFIAAIALLSAYGIARGATSVCADPLSVATIAASGLDLTTSEAEAIQHFYSGRGNRCAWSAMSEAALEQVLDRGSEQGLDPRRYHPDALRRLSNAQGDQDLAARDFVVTAMTLRYAHDMISGRVDLNQLEDDVDIRTPAVDPATGLADAADHETLAAWLNGLEPSNPDYPKLVTTLAFYREVAGRGGWGRVPPGPTLDLGQSDARIEALKQRLQAEGYLPPGTANPLFDLATKAALQSFQRRHGLTPDGRLGQATILTLNVPASERVDQIMANLERWRILGRALPAWGVTVNTAAATAVLKEEDQTVLSMHAVVGAQQHPTPMLTSAINWVIVNPPWVVPDSIIIHEVRPALRRDPKYLEHNQMSWIDGRLVQAPGPKNSLGQLKFELPNPFSVYMHDTSAHSLFGRSMRARSHGCVRLERPRDLALELLKDDPIWSRDLLDWMIAQGDTVKLPLHKRVPVAFVYWTVFVDEDGTVEFRDDLYGRDADLIEALRRPISAAAAKSCCKGG